MFGDVPIPAPDPMTRRRGGPDPASTPGRDAMIAARGLRKSFGEFEAVRGIDTAMAIAEGRDALTSFDSLGATRDADAAAALLRSLGSRPSRAAPLAASDLTRRELEVLTLLGEGLTNRQIADRLFITRKTVEHHVASVLAKAGLSGRTEAAAWAVRHLERAGKEQDPRIG